MSKLPDILAQIIAHKQQEVAQRKQQVSEADLIVLGPGDLYTSLIPNLLVTGVNEAIKKSPAKLLYICNLMTKHGETDGFTVFDFVSQVKRYLGPAAPKLETVLVNKNHQTPVKVLRRYQEEKSFPVEADAKKCLRLGVNLVIKPLAATGELFRHHPDKLAKAIVGLL